MLALASPASLKGVLAPAEAAAQLAAGLRRCVDVVEAPVADGGEGTRDVLQAALGGEWHTAAVVRPARAGPSMPRWLAAAGRNGGRRVRGGGRARPARDRRARPASRDDARPRRAAARRRRRAAARRCSSASAARRPSTAGRACGGSSAIALAGVPVRVACDVRNPLLGDAAPRAFSGRRRAPARRPSRSSSDGSRRSRSSRRIAT